MQGAASKVRRHKQREMALSEGGVSVHLTTASAPGTIQPLVPKAQKWLKQACQSPQGMDHRGGCA